MRIRNQKINVNHTSTTATQLKRTFPGLQILPTRHDSVLAQEEEVEGLARQIGAALEATTEAWHGSNLANPVLEDCKSRDPKSIARRRRSCIIVDGSLALLFLLRLFWPWRPGTAATTGEEACCCCRACREAAQPPPLLLLLLQQQANQGQGYELLGCEEEEVKCSRSGQQV